MGTPIGILDSGLGGLSIWKEIVKLLPHESTIYIADSKNCPYGSRSQKEIYELSRRLVQFLIKKNCKLIVIACNTITVSCLDKLRSEFKIPIIGTVPVIKTASELSKNKKIGVLSTKATAKSKYQKNLIKKFAQGCEVINIGTDKLVPFIEKGESSKMIQIILQKELRQFKKANIDTLALGCSHFPLIRDQIQQILGSNIQILDSGAAIARQTKRILENNDILSDNKSASHELFTTGNKEQFERVVRKYCSSKVENFSIRSALQNFTRRIKL